MSTNYDALADRAERGELKVKAGTVRRGDASRAEAQRLLMDATDTSAVDDAIRVGVGRPPVGTERGASPVVRGRVPQAIKDAVSEIMAAENRTESDVVREAIATYVKTRRAS